jgi:hypothetical protein
VLGRIRKSERTIIMDLGMEEEKKNEIERVVKE